MSRFLTSYLVALVALVPVPSAKAGEALELVMYERAGCAWCIRWDKEVAPIYPKTDIGKSVPLRRVNLDRKKGNDPVLEDPVRFTPTFVLLRDGKEAGRITGYHNDAFFWGLFESLVERRTEPKS